MGLRKLSYRIGMLGGLMACLIGLVWAQGSPSQEKNLGPQVGDMAPDFALKDLKGRTVRLSDFRNRQPVMMIFFSTS